MKEEVRILHLEDSVRDARLVRSILTEEGFDCEITTAENKETFLRVLEQERFDLILCDYNLPSFDGLTALALAKEKVPQIPFIFVSGTIGEERAIEALKTGATDYVLKENIARLGSAVRRALSDVEERLKRKETEEKNRELAALLDIDPSAILVKDMDDRILFWNKGAERLYGWTAKEVIGTRAQERFPEKILSEYARAKDVVLTEGQWEGEWTHMTRSGHEIVVQSSWALVRDEQGNPKAIYVVNSDVTEKKKLEAQFLRAQRMESIGTLAAGIAHDLNNILGPVMLAVGILRKKLHDQASTNLLNSVESSVKRGAEMVKHVLTFARGAGEERVNITLEHLVKEIVDFVKEAFPRTIEAKTRIEKNLWVVSGNPTQLHQVLVNLCVNARDAMPEGGVLAIAAENIVIDKHYARIHPDARSGRYVVVDVSDTGIGMPRSVKEKIFEPFFTTKEHGKGTGLGLSTVAKIIQGHGGFINVYSEVGKGTRFRVYLPALAPAPAEEVEARKEDLPGGSGQTILVVDDESTIREITRSTLESYGYSVLTAADGIEAIATYAQRGKEIDVVLCDMYMPFMDGSATIRALHKMNPDIKIIAISGFVENDVMSDDLKPRVKGFLNKPYSAEKLLKSLEKTIRS